MSKNKYLKNTVTVLKLASLYLMASDDDDNNAYDEMMERWREIDQDPRYDIYRDNPRYNDVFTPPNYWEAYPDDPRNPYRDDNTYYDQEYNENNTITVNNENTEKTENNNTPATTTDEKSKEKVYTGSTTSSSDDNSSSLLIFCIGIVLIIGILMVAPWLLII
ncbi:MAG: hypothetical protein IKF79_03825, partial [Methanosphaera sp.]|nr:hypothetical protein [Methanosphaera sp.]